MIDYVAKVSCVLLGSLLYTAVMLWLALVFFPVLALWCVRDSHFLRECLAAFLSGGSELVKGLWGDASTDR